MNPPNESNPYRSPNPVEGPDSSESVTFSGSPEARIARLEQQVFELERRLSKSWVFSPTFFARSFAILGHFFVAYMIIALPFIFLSFLLPLLLEGALK